jgi:hypothetical protein
MQHTWTASLFLTLFTFLFSCRDAAKMPNFPYALNLVSSEDPNLYTKMIDLTAMLGDDVKAFNEANPATPIQLVGKGE